MPDTLLEYCNAHLLPFPMQIDTILLTSITTDNSSQVAKVEKSMPLTEIILTSIIEKVFSYALEKG